MGTPRAANSLLESFADDAFANALASFEAVLNQSQQVLDRISKGQRKQDRAPLVAGEGVGALIVFKDLLISGRDHQRVDLHQMPLKHNATCRHRIPQMKYKVANWPTYEAGLRRRGSLTLWVTEDALAGWQAPRRRTRGGQPRYSDLAIETVLTLGCVFELRLRQSEGLMISLLDLLGLDLPIVDHTMLSSRAQTSVPRGSRQRYPEDGPLHVLIDSTGLKVFGAGQWLEDKYGARSRRTWRKLHLARGESVVPPMDIGLKLAPASGWFLIDGSTFGLIRPGHRPDRPSIDHEPSAARPRSSVVL